MIDVFSRYAWTRKLKSKTGTEVWKAFADIMKESGRKPKKIWVDQGGEFYNKEFKANLKKLGIIEYSSFGTHKSMMVERLNRTFKNWTWEYFDEENTRRWIDVLPDLVEEYNHKKHSSLGMTPIEASDPAVEAKLWKKQYGDVVVPKIGNPKFKLGDWVRISRLKGIHEKGYIANWSRQVYKIVGIDLNEPVMYTLQEENNEVVRGRFYEPELQKTDLTDVFLVEKVLKKRVHKGVPQIYVKWLGYDESYNSWINTKDSILLPNLNVK